MEYKCRKGRSLKNKKQGEESGIESVKVLKISGHCNVCTASGRNPSQIFLSSGENILEASWHFPLTLLYEPANSCEIHDWHLQTLHCSPKSVKSIQASELLLDECSSDQKKSSWTGKRMDLSFNYYFFINSIFIFIASLRLCN